MRALVAYGSKRGGTAGLAEMVGAELEGAGFEVDVAPAPEVRDVDLYDLVIVGGSLYANRWHKHARRFIRKNRSVLGTKPVWLFSSGPLDDSAVSGEIPPVGHVRKAMEQVGARGHMTFGGRLRPDASGFPAAAMAKDRAGDWRDRDHVHDWVSRLVHEVPAGT